MKIHSDEHGVHIRLTWVEKNHLRAVPTGLTPRTGHRREVLKQMVANEWPSPKEAADGTIGWFDQTMGANHWFSLSDVEPDRAAMLLCQHDPNSETLEHAKQCTNDITGPQDLLRLQQRFEDLAKCKPQHRTLLQWLDFARRSKLRYHPWIDQYVEAAGLAADAPTAAEPVPGVVAAAKKSKATQAAEKVAREDGRLRECEAEGLVFDKASANSLPYGVGAVAKKLNITRQSLSTDVKAALKRRIENDKNGNG